MRAKAERWKGKFRAALEEAEREALVEVEGIVKKSVGELSRLNMDGAR